MATIRYDKLHMEDLPYNRKIVIRYLRAAIHAHLTVMEIEGIEDQLRQQAEFLDPDPGAHQGGLHVPQFGSAPHSPGCI